VACCCAALGNSERAINLLRGYLGKVGGDPLSHIREMRADEDLATLRDELQALEIEYEEKVARSSNLFGINWR